MVWAYNISVLFYFLAIRIASVFNEKARLWLMGRRGVFKELESAFEGSSETAWFHCASLGEFEQGRPVMEKYRVKYPDHKIVVTFFSPSGYEIRKNYELADHICYLPIDSKKNAARFLSIVNPKMVFFVKYEFWLHYIKAIKNRGIPLFLISGVFRKDHVFFKAYGGLFRQLLNCFSHFFVQDENSKKLLSSIGINNCEVTGDTRFDRVCETAENIEGIPAIEQFKGNNQILIAGSTWPADEEVLFDFINSSKSELKYIIAPHEVKEENINRIMNSLSVKTIRYSKTDDQPLQDFKVLIIDNIGMLSMLYQYGRIAYIGGAFGKNVHNILEAAVFGIPVIYGPNYLKFKEAIDLVEKGGAFSVKSSDDFRERMEFILADPYIARIAGEVSRVFIQGSRGATDRIMKHLDAIPKD